MLPKMHLCDSIATSRVSQGVVQKLFGLAG